MKIKPIKKSIGLSIVAALFIGTAVDAGKIVTNATYTGGTTSSATAIVTPNKQFGFGGWDLDNVLVKIVSILDYSTALPGYDFNETTGFYTPMSVGKSFESEISSRTFAGDTAGELRGKLHGKDWPVGEPSGIKIINDDTAVQHGKPTNCIINSSYLEGYYLDSSTPRPVICSSDFQTHKRFKINMLSTMVGADNAWGKPVDMVFNLTAGDTTSQRYQVFQKINNYTNKRLDGYKIEVLDATGAVNPALTLSLGVGEETDPNTPSSDIFALDARATFSDGLWGPVDTQHDRPRGFFDDATAYYNVPNNAHSSVITGGTDGFLGANYQALFGNWLTSAWAPKGVFWDDDADPLTDAVLVAFYGKDPTNPTTDAWRKGEVDNWRVLTTAEIVQYSGANYAVDVIEDTLNLGINYIVEVGSNTAIGSKFTIRITPHTDANQTAPSYYLDTAGDYLTYIDTNASLSITPAPTFTVGTTLKVVVADADKNTDGTTKQQFDVNVTTSKGEWDLVTLIETDNNTSIFTGTLGTISSAVAGANDDGNISVEVGTVVSVTYTDVSNANNVLSASTTAGVAATTTTASSDGGGGGGFDALDTASFVAMILGFLGIGAYIARRRLAKQKMQ